MFRLRSAVPWLALALLVVLACPESDPPPAAGPRSASGARGELATFTGRFDPATGAITFSIAPPTSPGALTVQLPWTDGSPGSGPDNTFELRTVSAAWDGTSCGGGPALTGVIRLQSFFRNQQLKDVYAELIDVTPSGHVGCNSVAPAHGLGNAFGLWSYGTLGAKGSTSPADFQDQTWVFRATPSEAFVFHGRIMGTLELPTAIAGGPPFDWTPTSLSSPPRSFQVTGTTVAHVVWNGTRFVDTVLGTTFSEHGGPGGSVATGLDDPSKGYATFGGGSYWVEDQTGATVSAYDLSGDFSACVKFKPGLPGMNIKVLFAKGNAANGFLGWANMQMNEEYCFHYRTADDNTANRGDVMSYTNPGTGADQWEYSYHCGGRAGGAIWVGAHGMAARTISSETTNFTGTSLPLVVGAYANGSYPAVDAGVYEAIIDSRPASQAVFNELVARAEGRLLPGSDGTSAALAPTNASLTTVTGSDALSHALPPYATVPVSTDGSGLLDAGVSVQYARPLTTDTSTTGFCVNAYVQATGPWASASGSLFGLLSTGTGAIDALCHLNPFHLIPGGNGYMPSSTTYNLPAAWADGSEHLLQACVDPADAAYPFKLYVDRSYGAPFNRGTGSVRPNLSAETMKLGIGGEAVGQAPRDASGGTMRGARIRRLFICPSADPSTCL